MYIDVLAPAVNCGSTAQVLKFIIIIRINYGFYPLRYNWKRIEKNGIVTMCND